MKLKEKEISHHAPPSTMLMTLSGFCLIRVEVEAEDWEELFRLELLEELELDIRREKVSLKKKRSLKSKR
jgi:hypothetical protein